MRKSREPVRNLAMDVRHALQASLGLETVRYRYELSPSQLFHEAIANDRGRVRTGGGDAERKAFATRLGVQGPLVFHSDPSCTGRPVQDTFAVAWPEVERRIWWKDSLRPFDPDHFEPPAEAGRGRISTPPARPCTCRTGVSGSIPPTRSPIASSGSTPPTRSSPATCFRATWPPRQPGGEALDDAQRPVLPVRARARRNAHGTAPSSSTSGTGSASSSGGPTTAESSRSPSSR